MPFVLLPLLENHGSGAVFVCIGTAMVVLSIDIAVLGPRTTGRPLEDVAGADAPDVPATVLAERTAS